MKIEREIKMEQKKTFFQKVKAAGPAAVITSAFIGPGTITTSTIAGANFGYALLWSVVFSGFSLIVIMNMASRLGIGGRKNIIEGATDLLPNSNVWKIFIALFIAVAIGLTALGFEAGNIIGATTGLSDILGIEVWLAGLVIGILSAAAIWFSTPSIIELIMKAFVALMGIIFLVTAIIVGPDLGALFAGFIPSVPDGALVTTVALIGTTIIGINLVFHSIAATDKWDKESDIEDSKFDTNVNVSLGVVMTLAVIITTSAVLFGTGTEVNSPIVFAQALEPVLGTWARSFAALGLVLAGLSSAIATPYMTGVIFGKVFNWKSDSINPKLVAMVAVVFGTVLAMQGQRPTQIIVFAQATSGVFLPFISLLFVLAANSKKLGKFKNTTTQNVLGFISFAVTFFLGMWTLYNLFF